MKWVRHLFLLAGLAAVCAAACSSESTGGSAPADSSAAGSSAEQGDQGTDTTPSPQPRLIVDTDLSLWWDDATAVGLANLLHQRDELHLLGVATDVPNAVAVAAVDAIGTAYGNPDIPLGAMAGSSEDTFEHGYTDVLLDRLDHSVAHSDEVPEAVPLYRRLLAEEADRSVTIVSLGAWTNLAGLLESPADAVSDLDGRTLIGKKVRQLVIMDGLFPQGGPPLTNQEIDPEAARTVVTGDWPTPIAWVDGFSGVGTLVGGTLCEDTPPDHPMRIVYEELFGCSAPGDGNWDAPTLLYAVGDIPGAFEELGGDGAAVINDSGGLSWATSSGRTGDVYVRVVDQQALNRRIDELLVSG
jgi:hypothetical protein